MGDVVLLSNITPIDLLSDTGHAFVVDCTRAGEGLITDRELQEKYELTPLRTGKTSRRTWRSGVPFGLNGSAACSTAPPHARRHADILSKRRQFSIRS